MNKYVLPGDESSSAIGIIAIGLVIYALSYCIRRLGFFAWKDGPLHFLYLISAIPVAWYIYQLLETNTFAERGAVGVFGHLVIIGMIFLVVGILAAFPVLEGMHKAAKHEGTSGKHGDS